MATPYSKVYSIFLTLITEDFYAEVEQIVVNSTETYRKQQELIAATIDDLTGLLNMACARFKYPRTSLNRDDATQTFQFDLDIREQEILAFIMREKWASRWVFNLDTIRQNWGDRDFDYTSQANHLKALIKMNDLAVFETRRAQNDYSRSVDYKPNFQGLAGGSR